MNEQASREVELILRLAQQHFTERRLPESESLFRRVIEMSREL